MKKITTLFAAAVMAASASAQTVTESKTFDNMYFGINTGVSTATKGHHWLQDFRPNLGVLFIDADVNGDYFLTNLMTTIFPDPPRESRK